jgi:hypothetical protein
MLTKDEDIMNGWRIFSARWSAVCWVPAAEACDLPKSRLPGLYCDSCDRQLGLVWGCSVVLGEPRGWRLVIAAARQIRVGLAYFFT